MEKETLDLLGQLLDVTYLDWFANLREFHETMDLTIGKTPGFRDVELRVNLIREEVLAETIPAIERGDMVEAIDGIVDSIYVLVGAAVTFGVDLRPIFAAVHAANMAKKGGPVREDGKRLKPEGWKAADVAALLRAQGWRG
jgi:predicted HAD superfamily Cof-like phosphohydrolase